MGSITYNERETLLLVVALDLAEFAFSLIFFNHRFSTFLFLDILCVSTFKRFFENKGHSLADSEIISGTLSLVHEAVFTGGATNEPESFLCIPLL